MPADRRPIKASMDFQADIIAKAEEVRLALRAKLNARGRTLTNAVGHVGRLLPKKTGQTGGYYCYGAGFEWQSKADAPD